MLNSTNKLKQLWTLEFVDFLEAAESFELFEGKSIVQKLSQSIPMTSVSLPLH